MDPTSTFRLRDVSALTGSLAAFAIVALLIVSGTATQDVMAASGLVTDFVGAGDTIQINFTKIGGSDNIDYSIKLPKQSNVVEASLNVTGEDIFIGNQFKSFKSAFDFRAGTKTNLIYDTSGLHLDMDTLAPFWPGSKKTTGSNPMDVVGGDFNNDGLDDFVTVNYDSDSATVYYQNNQGKMITKTTHATSDQPNCIDVGDFNKDGRDDFAVGSYTGRKVDFFYQKATGGFTKYSYSVNLNILGLATGDFNNDGLDDVVLATYGKKGVTVLQTVSSGFTLGQTMTVGESGQYYYYNHDVHDVAVADFNKDGRDDVVFATAGLYTYNRDYTMYGKIKFYYQTSSGTLSYKTSIYGYTGCWNIAAGDFSGDGRPDIATSHAYTNKVKVWYQTGGGGWSGPTNLGGDGRVYRLDIADFDGDGKKDLAAASAKPTLLLYKQSAGKVSTQAKKFDLPASGTGRAVGHGDFNDDGFIDAVTADGGANSASVFLQRLEYDGSFISAPIKQPLPIRYINFTYGMTSRGGTTAFYYSLNGGSDWMAFTNGSLVDLVNRTDSYWIKITYHSESASRYDSVKWVTMNMTYQTFPSNIYIDLGRDNMIEWNNSGELIGSETVDDLADSLTEYVQNTTHSADADGYVTIPMEIYSKTPGILHISDLWIVYNNASRRPELVFPRDKGFVNATPTINFYANDTDNDRLKYKVQITSTNFIDSFNTMSFDMRYALYDEIEGEGFTAPDFLQGVVATFTLPEAYQLKDDTTYKWRVFAFDGYLMSRPSPTFIMKVDSHSPTGHASSPRYSNELNFTITWAAEDVMPGSGLAPAGTYDMQFRRSTEPTWNDWLLYTSDTEAVFNGEEGVTFYFRMRARDAVWNEQLFIGGKGDTQTTVDTQAPTVTFSDMPGFQDTRTFLVRWIGSDFVPGSGIRFYDVQVKKEDGPWMPWQSEFKSSQAVYTADADKTYHFQARATDQGGNVGEWSEMFSVRIDATPPLLDLAPTIPLDGEPTWGDLGGLTVVFAFRDPESGIRSVEVTVGTERGLFDVMPPTLFPYPEDGTLYLTGLPLINSYTYFVGVRAENQAGAWGSWEWSDGVLVAIPGPETTMSYPEGRVSDIRILVEISVVDPRDYNVTLGDLRMRSATMSGDDWTWSEWQRISNSKTDVTFEGKRGFRYQFRYRAQNELGSWGEFVEFAEGYWVFINNPPVANGGPSQRSRTGETVQFSADGSEDRDGDDLTYSWDFGDGDQATGLYASHKFDKAGLYNVELTVSDGFEESVSRTTVYVEEQQQTPGFGPMTAMLAMFSAALIAITLSRKRRS